MTTIDHMRNAFILSLAALLLSAPCASPAAAARETKYLLVKPVLVSKPTIKQLSTLLNVDFTEIYEFKGDLFFALGSDRPEKRKKNIGQKLFGEKERMPLRFYAIHWQVVGSRPRIIFRSSASPDYIRIHIPTFFISIDDHFAAGPPQKPMMIFLDAIARGRLMDTRVFVLEKGSVLTDLGWLKVGTTTGEFKDGSYVYNSAIPAMTVSENAEELVIRFLIDPYLIYQKHTASRDEVWFTYSRGRFSFHAPIP